MKKRYEILIAAGIIILLTGIDQWTKRFAFLYLRGKQEIPIIPDVFVLSYLENQGAAFGIFQNQRWIFLVITCLVSAFVLYCFFKLPSVKRYLPLKLICTVLFSGAVGNMIDRIGKGYVIDFFYFKLIDFPVFNMADIYVVVSSIAFLLLFTFYYKEEEFTFLKLSNKAYKEEKRGE